jgi:hypothetical protein
VFQYAFLKIKITFGKPCVIQGWRSAFQSEADPDPDPDGDPDPISNFTHVGKSDF